MTAKSREVDAYLKKQTPERRTALEEIRALIRKTVPQAVESMKYRMPTYEIDEVVCAFASQKQYMSLYMDTGLVAKYNRQLRGLDCGKSCIRFRKLEDLPLSTIRRMLMETVQRQRGR